MTLFVFDLDGVLIDSEQLIRESYREAGVEPPENFMSLGHHDWIAPEDRERVHRRKNDAYIRRLTQGVRTLPPWRTAEFLIEAGKLPVVLTGAPRGTKWALRPKGRDSWPFVNFYEEYTPTIKAGYLRSCVNVDFWSDRQSDCGTVYVDDQEYVEIPPGCKFVKYTGQSAVELFREMTS